MTHPLASQIAAFINGGPDDDEFNRLALALFAHQYAHSAPLRRLWDADHAAPARVTHWTQIPAVPVAAFKRFRLTCVPDTDIVAEFHSSGTTGSETSRHLLGRDALELYETSLRVGYNAALPHAPRPLLAVMPPPSEAPHSSLSHMLGTLGAEEFLAPRSALRQKKAMTLFGTAFALAAMLENTDADMRLTPQSVIVETGGFKGRTREIPRTEFYGRLAERFGVPVASIYSEYGMCEMASQFYSSGLNETKRGPHWVKTRAIDPDTGDDAVPGEPGLLRHLDLANLNSALCLQTHDRGVLTSGPPRIGGWGASDGFVLMGRASDAALRGCSLTAEEAWT